nr:hypothetical protein [Candidatus Sigynarchaeota archaeon]
GRVVVLDGVYMYVVNCSSALSKNELKPGAFVGLNTRTHAVVEIVPNGIESNTSADWIQRTIPSDIIGKKGPEGPLRDVSNVSRSDQIRLLLKEKLFALPVLYAVVTTEAGEIVSSTGDWHPDRDEIRKIIAAWRDGSMMKVTLKGIEFTIQQAKPNAFFADNQDKGNIIGSTMPDGSRLLAYYSFDERQRKSEKLDLFIKKIEGLR